MKICVSGATGFVGQHFVRTAIARGHQVKALVRTHQPDALPGAEQVAIGDMSAYTSWDEAVAGADAVVHLAARVHVMDETDSDPDAAYRRLNVEPTVRLAEAAARGGISRFIFMSSIKVNGELTTSAAFRRHSTPRPVDAYGRSKYDAELQLQRIASHSSMVVNVIRPPVVYGVGVRGNIRRIIGAVRKGIPMPLGAVNNKRTMIAVENLTEAVFGALQRESEAYEVFLVGDPRPISTRELVSLIASGMGRKARLVNVPPRVLTLAATVLRRKADVDRLLQDLEVIPDWDALGVDIETLIDPSDAIPALAKASRGTP